MRQLMMFDDPALKLAEIKRLQRWKARRTPRETPNLGGEVVKLFTKQIRPRQEKFGQIGEAWVALVPAAVAEHCCIESFNRGTLTVKVDSSAHLYELKQLLLAGLQDELTVACPSACLRKVNLRPGRWYQDSASGRRDVLF
jgi:hypothetical protein